MVAGWQAEHKQETEVLEAKVVHMLTDRDAAVSQARLAALQTEEQRSAHQRISLKVVAQFGT